ncbi:MAG TPA: serine/threonine-protein kinase [Clostridiales bacterium]|nr:serine/threonine-protein kinase [Clostridiales bacterium]
MENTNDKYIGKILDDRYEIIELIGSGGMANVYKALCHRLNRYDAVKIMRDETAANTELRRRFRAESQAVAMLSHPNIVSVYDVSHNDDVEYIVMELIDGITLKQYLQKKSVLDPAEVLDFTIQTAKALEHAHSKGIIHRDIKPQNIMLLKDGMIKVADFGIASLENTVEENNGETVGSVHYIAPEQARGEAPDARSDIYSLGIVMYEMLTGRLPYVGNSDVEVAVKHMNTDPVTPRDIVPSIPEELERICLKAMNSNIDERYQTASEMLADLEQYKAQSLAAHVLEDSEAVLIDSEEPPRRRAQRSRRSKKIALSSGILAVLLFVIIGFVFLNGYFLKDLFSDPVKVKVDNFVGRYYEDVINDKDYKKIYDFKVTFKVDLEHEYGIILSQDPESGRSKTVSDKGSKIVVELVCAAETVDDQKRLLKVPYIVNHEREEAISMVQDAGFTYSLEQAPSDSITKGYVISTDPVAGAAADEGSEIKIIISTGPETVMTKVPQLKGLSKDAAIAKIESSNLSIGSISTAESDLDAGTVIDQNIAAGTEIEEHTKISITVSSGPSGNGG